MEFDLAAYSISKATSDKYDKFVKYSLKDKYYMLCVKRCIHDFSSNLTGVEKICLAKCLDRAIDFFRIEGKNLNPFVERKESRHLKDINKVLESIEIQGKK